jgi:hypothetical protein
LPKVVGSVQIFNVGTIVSSYVVKITLNIKLTIFPANIGLLLTVINISSFELNLYFVKNVGRAVTSVESVLLVLT